MGQPRLFLRADPLPWAHRWRLGAQDRSEFRPAARTVDKHIFTAYTPEPEVSLMSAFEAVRL